MTTLRIPPAQQPWPVSNARPARTVTSTVRAGWVWCQRGLLALAILLFLVLALLPKLGLYRPVTVLSGSMRPTFSPGDMVLVTPEPLSAVRVGQVISYRVPTGVHQIETHRIIKILSGGAHPVVQTQGDANNWPDPWTARLEGRTAWQMTAVVPRLGYLVNWFRGPQMQRVAVLIAPVLLALLMLSEIWGAGSNAAPRVRKAGAVPLRSSVLDADHAL